MKNKNHNHLGEFWVSLTLIPNACVIWSTFLYHLSVSLFSDTVTDTRDWVFFIKKRDLYSAQFWRFKGIAVVSPRLWWRQQGQKQWFCLCHWWRRCGWEGKIRTRQEVRESLRSHENHTNHTQRHKDPFTRHHQWKLPPFYYGLSPNIWNLRGGRDTFYLATLQSKFYFVRIWFCVE